jgi:hypothetical protein
MKTKALQLYAGPRALAHVRAHGLRASDVRAIPAAAGGPKGLILGPLDRFLFGQWLTESSQPIDLVGASIGAWRMATACCAQPVAKFEQLQRDYIAQDYVVEPGKKRPSAAHVSARFGATIAAFYAAEAAQVLQHPRFRLHVITSRGRWPLTTQSPLHLGAGFAAAYAANAVGRLHMGKLLERVVFSAGSAALPWADDGYPTTQVALTEANFAPAVQASCSIPFVLQPVLGRRPERLSPAHGLAVFKRYSIDSIGCNESADRWWK